MHEFYKYLNDVYKEAILAGKTHAEATSLRRQAQVEAQEVSLTEHRPDDCPALIGWAEIPRPSPPSQFLQRIRKHKQ